MKINPIRVRTTSRQTPSEAMARGVSTNTSLKYRSGETDVRDRQSREFIRAARDRRYPGARAAPGAMDRLLGAAMAAACDARHRGRNFPCRLMARLVAVAAADRTGYRARRIRGAGRSRVRAVHSCTVPLSL